MNLIFEAEKLREMLASLVTEPEWELMRQYDLLRDRLPNSPVDRWFLQIKNRLASYGLIQPHLTQYEWLPAVKHSPLKNNSITLLIWAMGGEKDELHTACEVFTQRLGHNSGIVPVLVTDIPDFFFFSRLKWLVEYVPEISGEGPSYKERKQKYLAWRYRNAIAVPASACNANEMEWNELMRIIS